SHPKVAEGLRNLAKVHLDMGNSQEASLHLRRSQMIQENDLTVTTISSQRSFAGVSSILDDSTFDLTAR
ncbi:tetratricopeptide repeat protein, partial [Salmonella sp. s54925]|uniref:tetratricopeptide repeat protein n=1 Tax=Salmonella sp. s54925 TaxID=3159674 RepID=UPI00397EFA71